MENLFLSASRLSSGFTAVYHVTEWTLGFEGQLESGGIKNYGLIS
jgi:hypothetical protein